MLGHALCAQWLQGNARGQTDTILDYEQQESIAINKQTKKKARQGGTEPRRMGALRPA